MKKSTFLLVCLPLLLTSCSEKLSKEIIIASKVEAILGNGSTKQVDPFDTLMQANLYLDKEEIKELENIKECYNNKISYLHAQFDRHENYKIDEQIINNVKQLNESWNTQTFIKVSDELFDLLKLSYEIYDYTDGAFNIFNGRISDFWNECFDYANALEDIENFDPFYNVERKELLENYVSNIPNTKEDYEQQLSFDENNKSVRFNKLSFQSEEYRPTINLGGVAKGYANDLVSEMFYEKGIKKGILYSGASSISLLFDPTFLNDKKNKISVSVINPIGHYAFENVSAFTLEIKNKFNLSTSGDYTSGKYYYFMDDNQNVIRRYHIFSCKDGYCVNNYRQVSILSKDMPNYLLDALSTSFLTLKSSQIKTIINNLKANYDIHVYLLKEIDNKAILYASDKDLSIKLGEGVSVIYEI